MSRLLLRGLQAVPLFLAAGFLLPACATLSSEESDPTLFPSEVHVVGHIVWVDAAEGTAVVQIRRGATISTQAMIARNDALIETARLQAAGLRQGQTLGVRIVEGLPNAGDEVVLVRPVE